MIIIGYSGIGKSSVAGVDNGCIDLESNNFWYEDKRSDDWYIYYCKTALDLSRQGFTVFVSSHKEVREYLWNHVLDDLIICISPEVWLENEWIIRLQKRYDEARTNKNYKALMNVKNKFKESVKEMQGWGGYYYGIESVDYDLMDIIRKIRRN